MRLGDVKRSAFWRAHLTKKGLLDAKIQLLSGHSSRQSLAIYQAMSLAADYQEAMRDFPVK